jgi:Ca2+-binding RTX toxin-like protein
MSSRKLQRHPSHIRRTAVALERLESRRLLATIAVTTLADSGAGSLRQAIADATAGDMLDASGLTGTINLNSTLAIDKSLTIVGPGTSSLAISGQDTVRVVDQSAGTVTVRDLTIRNGNAGTGWGGGWNAVNASVTFERVRLTENVAFWGGAIAAEAGDGTTVTVDLIDSSVDENNARWLSGAGINTIRGGGIWLTSGSGSTGSTLNFNAAGSTIANNLATAPSPEQSVAQGGGVYGLAAPGPSFGSEGGTLNIDIVNSTLVGNQVRAIGTDNVGLDGGALVAIGDSNYVGSVAEGKAYLTLRNVTVTESRLAASGGSISATYGAGIALNEWTTWEVDNSIIYGNTGAAEIGALGASLQDSSHNLFGSTATMFTDGVNNNRVGVDPLLGTLGDHGGLTQTVPLLAGSPAIDAGNNAVAPTRDQRGYYRSGASDVGAFEFNGLPPNTPEIAVYGNGNSVEIVAGDLTPSISDHTDFGSVLRGGSISRTFTVRNIGDVTLNTGIFFVPEGFKLDLNDLLETTIAAGGSGTFTVVLNSPVAGTYAGNLVFANSDDNENPYAFAITGTITAPEIQVTGNTQNISSGDSTPSSNDHTDFGSVLRGGSISRTFTVHNTGTATLNTSNLAAPGGFTIDPNDPLAASIPAGGSETFTVILNSTFTGTYTGNISFTNDDTDEASFTFAITGTITAPVIQVTGNTRTITSGDSTPSSLDHTAFGSVSQGGSIARTFTVRNTGDATLSVSTLTLPSGFTLDPNDPLATDIAGGGSDTFTVRLNTATAGTFAGDIRLSTNDTENTPFVFAISGSVLPLVARVRVTGNSTVITNGDFTPSLADRTDMGSRLIAVASWQPFVITNTGTAALLLSNAILPFGYAFDTTRPMPSTVAAGQQATFAIYVSVTTPGTYTGNVSFTTNDPDNATFRFAVTQTVGWSVVEQGALMVHTLGNNDDIRIDTSGANLLSVSVNGVIDTHSSLGVSLISVWTGAGNDHAEIAEGISIAAVLNGEEGKDTLIGGGGNDTLSGGAQPDALFGGAGNDRLGGNGGNDRLYGGGNDDRLYGNDGNDTLDGGLRVDRLWGGNGNDLLIGGGSADKIYGEADHDTLLGQAGVDYFNGGTGTDSADLAIDDYQPISIEVLV